MLCQCLLVTTVSNEKSAVSMNVVSLYIIVFLLLSIFFQSCFQDFLLAFGFSNLIMTSLDVDIFLFIPFGVL